MIFTQGPYHLPPSHVSRQLLVVLYIVSPKAGERIASRSVRVIRGGKKPFVVLEASSTAEGSGVSGPIPTSPWAKTCRGRKIIAAKDIAVQIVIDLVILRIFNVLNDAATFICELSDFSDLKHEQEACSHSY
jgi:hypothetical protein